MLKFLFAVICFSAVASEPTSEQLELMRQYHLTVPPIILDVYGRDKNLVKAEILDNPKHIEIEMLPGEVVELPLRNVELIDDSNFHKAVSGHGVVFVDFYADWCGPCRSMAAVIENLAHELLTVRFKKVDVDASPVTRQTVGVPLLPTFAVYVDGKLSALRSGAMSQLELRRWIESNFSQTTSYQESVYVPRTDPVVKSRVNARGSCRSGW